MSSNSQNPSTDLIKDAAREMRTQIATAIAEDKKYRVPGVTAGLYRLSELRPFAHLDPAAGIPTIQATSYNGSTRPTFDRAADDAEFHARLHKAAPYLAEFDLKKWGLCVAGGAASALTMRPTGVGFSDASSFHDVDLFLVGHKTDADAKAAALAVGAHLSAWLVARGCRYTPLKVFRTTGCITYYSSRLRRGDRKEIIVQIVLRRYATAAEVIHGFDLGSSAFLWNGEHVFVTAMGRLAAEHGINVLNLEARRNSYEDRLTRYFDRGYSLVLPRLDVAAVAELEGELPYLTIGLNVSDAVVSHTITAYGLYPARNAHSVTKGGSDYAMFAIPYSHPSALCKRNMRAFRNGGFRVEALCAHSVWSPSIDPTTIQPMVSAAAITQLASSMCNRHAVDIDRLTALLGGSRAAALTDAIALRGGPSAESLDSIRTDLRNLFATAVIPFEFMAVLANTALTGPFPRAVLTEAEWYGPALYGSLYVAPAKAVATEAALGESDSE